MYKFHAERGSAYYYVLVGIVLFAALSFAMTRTNRGTLDMTKEEAELAASEVTDFLKEFQNSISRMIMAAACDEGELDFNNSVYRFGTAGGGGLMYVPTDADVGPYHNANAPRDGHCNTFDDRGAGLEPRILDAALGVTAPAGSRAATAHLWFATAPLNDVPSSGSTAYDLVVTLPHVPEDICRAFNKKAGVGGADGDPVLSLQWFNGNPFSTNGSYTATDVSNGDALTETPSGARRFCHTAAASVDPDDLHITMVLIER